MINAKELISIGFELMQNADAGNNQYEHNIYYGYEIREDTFLAVRFSHQTYGGYDDNYISLGLYNCGCYEFLRDIENIEQIKKLYNAITDKELIINIPGG